MSRLRKLLAVSFRAKVLVPVIFVMVCLLAVTAWVVNQRITKQFESEAIMTLNNADQGFQHWRRNRAEALLLRTSSLRKEPSLKATLSQTDTATMSHALPALREAAGDDVKIVL